ncbi:tripartite tricarboxylate transporter TctB family protein [Oceanicella sp. SM1341]|uniref:tripartite tricarboxylate transporter TctB family protein n=1 Tax=Oceanicella sp. SM1341 TaxID=1548889 RepID=UPI000E48572F|nr:tripartite tricarboxylate transporter TctB family protein [Oceanicella sp. SM1341]
MTQQQAPTPPRHRPKPGGIVFAAALALAMLGYAWSILDSARSTVDWLMILPAAGVGVIALAWAALRDAAALRAIPAAAKLPALKGNARPVALLVLICVYAASLPFAGFDLGTALFIAIALLIQGERRIWLIALNAVLGTGLLVWVFHDLLMVRLPTLLM